MNDTAYTLSSPLAAKDPQENPLLALTICWHPDESRIGEQFISTDFANKIELNRYFPVFQKTGGEGLPIGHGAVSRDPVRIERSDQNRITITPPSSKMIVEVNGNSVTEPISFQSEETANGIILALGRSVIICLHWMRSLPKMNTIPGVIGVSDAAIHLRDQIRQIAGTSMPVLLLGETGTGKEVAAQAIHRLSARQHLPMVSVNMAALNESLAAADLFGAARGAYTGAQQTRKGYFSEASGSSLFLDEIGNTPSAIQPMLLRVLETGEYRPLGASQDMRSDARLITATDQDLYSVQFNQALLRRLESFVIHLPPLRERREDIGVLIVHLRQQTGIGSQQVLPFEIISELMLYSWPGNIRQLSHVLRRILIALQSGENPRLASLVQSYAPHHDSAINITHSTPPGSASQAKPSAPRKRLHELSEDDVTRAMIENDWYIQGAAQALGISRPSMYKLLDQHSQIRRPEQIAHHELQTVLQLHKMNIELSAAELKTPSEALRRYARAINLI